MPVTRSHLASLVDDFEKRGRDTAVVTLRGVREQRTTYRELAALSRRFASELQLRGIAKGDRIVLWGDNSATWVAAFFGSLLNGSLPVPVDAASPPSFVDLLLADVTPKLLVTDHTRTNAPTPQVPLLSLSTWPNLITKNTDFAIPCRYESDPLQIVFTSGTTGNPKGIVHTHKNVLASVRPIETEIAKYLRYERPFHPIRILHTLPLSHVFGQFMGLWIPPLLGAEIHYEHRLVATELIEYIHAKRISVLAAVPRVLDLLQSYLLQQFPTLPARLAESKTSKAHIRWWRFRDVHRVFGLKFWAFVCGGASLAPVSESFWNGLGFPVIQGYGMTETTALVSVNHPFKLAQGTVGRVLPGREVRLTSEGEVQVRGETISNIVWQNGHLHEAGPEWLSTGDLAELDRDGNLYFRGRRKDVIVTAAGLNIYPDDLEAPLLRQPGVKACTVVESEGAAGPEPLAVLVISPGTDIASVIDIANRELAEFQWIHRWLEWPEPDLPRTSTGKILRREITRRIAAGELAHSFAKSPGADLNLDSLGRVQLQAELESRFGVTLQDEALQQVRTGEDLHTLVRQASAGPPKTLDRIQHSYPHWPWSGPVQLARSLFLELVAMPLIRFLIHPRIRLITGPIRPTPVLLFANHVTSYDVPFVLSALPRAMRRKVAVAMSGEMILDWRLARRQGHWLLNWVAPLQYIVVTALFNIFPLPQLTGFRRSFRHAGEAIDAGYSVLIFPEGRRSDDGQLQPFKSGAGLLWQELNVPAVPVYLAGLGELKTRRARWFRTGTISVSAGPVLYPSSGESPEHLTRQLRNAILDLQQRP